MSASALLYYVCYTVWCCVAHCDKEDKLVLHHFLMGHFHTLMSNLISVHAPKLFRQEKLKLWEISAEDSTTAKTALSVYCKQINMTMVTVKGCRSKINFKKFEFIPTKMIPI